MSRRNDEVKIEVIGPGGESGVLDNFNSFEITNSIIDPGEAAFEIGDDATWRSINDLIKHGTQYKIFINGRLRLTGRVELNDIPLDASGGSDIQFTIRTKLADAMFASANPSIQVKNQSIVQYLAQLYNPLGYVESDFIFPNDAYKSRDLITGKDTSGQGKTKNAPEDLEKIKPKDAKVQPSETIYDAADRHLRRHGLMHWDSPDGKIVVSAPNDLQDPIYYFRTYTGYEGRENNVLKATRSQDWSEIPTRVSVYGVGAQRGFSKSRVSAVATDRDVWDAGFYRPVDIVAEGIKTLAIADRAAVRELAARSKYKDAWDIEIDGLSWWNGMENIPIGIDTVADIVSNLAGGPLGTYYIHRVVHKRDASGGDITNISMVKRGVWQL